MTMWRSAAEALANHWMTDLASVRESKYQPSRVKDVFVVGDHYWTALPASREKLPEGWDWVQVSDAYIEKHGWRIFKADP